MRSSTACALACLCLATAARAASPVYLWLEAEWFDGVDGRFAYWTGGPYTPTGKWAITGPGISPEWTQGGESEWSSMGAPAEETRARCRRDVVVPRAGRYRIWVRYVDHRDAREPFRVTVEQRGRPAIAGTLGDGDVVPRNDEYQLYWGFSLAWASVDGELAAGPARVELAIDRRGDAWRQVDAVLLTDDLAYVPVAREKPPFRYLETLADDPAATAGATWRGSGRGIATGATWHRPTLGGRDFALWTGITPDDKWWAAQDPGKLTLGEILLHDGAPHDLREAFAKQYGGRRDVPILSWHGMVPGLHLPQLDLSPASPVRAWLERTKIPFYVLTNYAVTHYDGQSGPATYAALTGPLASQFLGFIHGEAVGPPGVELAQRPLAATRRAHLEAALARIVADQAAAWTRIFKTDVPQSFFRKSIACLSTDLNNALVHGFRERGEEVTGYEEDSTAFHVPLRIAFQRGAARQYGGTWIDYASGNFGDACNSFAQQPVVPRGAKAWFHSKYAITDGVSASWYRKLYYLNYLGGASAIFWEQNLDNQFILPGPGTHPIELSPFGRATVEFQAFVDRLGDRGEPYTPIAVLLGAGHSYTHVSYNARMLEVFPEDADDRALRELFNVLWAPAAVLEGEPAAPDVQSMPGGVHGNLYDVLVDRPAHARALLDYPVVWAAGDVDLAPLGDTLDEYLRRGGTLVVDVRAAAGLRRAWLGFRPAAATTRAESWFPDGATPRATTPYDVTAVTLDGAQVLAWAAPGVPLVTRRAVGEAPVVAVLVPRGLGLDERAHPALPWLLDGLVRDLVPVDVRLADGTHGRGELQWQVNRAPGRWIVLVVNGAGVDKTPSGVARVDRRAARDVVVRTRFAVAHATEGTQPRALAVTPLRGGGAEVRLRVGAGDLAVVDLAAP